MSENVVGAIEKTLFKTPSIYRYNEVIQANKAGNMSIFSLESQSEESFLHYALVQHSSVPTPLIHSIIKNLV